MDELLRAIRHFITRDLVFLVAGAITVGAFLYRFDRLPLGSVGLPLLLLAAGVCYVVGFTIQALASLLKLVTTEQLRVPGRFTRWLFHWLTGEVWSDVPASIDRAAVRRSLGEVEVARIERVVMLKQLCASVGPSSFLAGGIVLTRYLALSQPFDLYLSIAAFLSGLVLIPLARLKAAQEAKAYHRLPLPPDQRAV